MGYAASLNNIEPLLMAVNQPAPKLPGVMTKDKDALPALGSKVLCQSKGTVRSRVTEQMSAPLEKEAGALIHTCQSKSKACPAVSPTQTQTHSLGVSDAFTQLQTSIPHFVHHTEGLEAASAEDTLLLTGIQSHFLWTMSEWREF